MNKRQNPLCIRVGDVVEISFDHDKSRGAFHATVTEVADPTLMGSHEGSCYDPTEIRSAQYYDRYEVA